MWNPWQVLADEHPDVTVVHCTLLPAGVLGATDGRTIWLAADQTIAERRCTLTHELVHLRHGHRGHQPPRAEAHVSREAARLLIPLEALVRALAWARCEAEAADELWVDTATLRTRLSALSARERLDVDACAALWVP